MLDAGGGVWLEDPPENCLMAASRTLHENASEVSGYQYSEGFHMWK